MYHSRAQVDRISAQDAGDENVCPLDLVIRDLEYIARLTDQRLTHLHRARRCLGIDTAYMSHAHHEIAVAHHLAEDPGRHFFQRHGSPFAPTAEGDLIDHLARYFRSGPAMMTKLHGGHD